MQDLKDALKLVEALKEKRETNQFKYITHYPEQIEYMNDKRRRVSLFGGNRTGKSRTGSFEVTCHLTGEYPDWWDGVRFKRPVNIWVIGESTDRVRDTIQEKLFGGIGRWGTGMIPKDRIVLGDSKSGFNFLMKSGVQQAIDIALINHKSGGISSIQFFSYEKGRDKFQGSAIDWIWMDEEPPSDVYGECKMRILDTNGYMRFTFTPLGGITELYDELMHDEKVGKHYLPMSSAKHLSEEAKEELLSGYSEAERNARENGIATIGSGKVFQFQEDEYVCEDFEIPRHWRRIGGLDVGLDHPTCAVSMAIDDEASCVYVYKEYKKAGATPITHTTHLRNWGLEFSTDPHAFDRAIGTGISAATVYEDDGHGLKVFKAPAGPGSVDASINKIRAWIGSGRFWIFKTCKELIDEMRLYRTDKNGKIYKVNDDLVDAMRYAFMSIDKATIDGRRKASVDFTIEEWKPSSKYGY